jgi:hypothetical protein
MANRQIHQLTPESSLDSTFVIPIQKADGSQEAKKTTIESLKEPLGIADFQVYKTVKVTLSSAEILDLFTTPVELVPAVSGKLLVPQFFFQKYNHVSSAYTTSGVFRIGLGTPNFGFGAFTPAITSADNAQGLNNISYAQSTSGLEYQGKAIVIGASVANPTGGDGNLDLYLTYLEITLG